MQRVIFRFFAVLLAFVAAGTAFAKDKKSCMVPPSAQITEKDVMAFADNFSAISESLRSYGCTDDDMSLDDMVNVIGKEEVEKILEKNGISAPDQVRKINMIILCYSKAKLEKEIADAPFFLRFPMVRKIRKEFDLNINPDDEMLVKRNFDYFDGKISDIFDDGE